MVFLSYIASGETSAAEGFPTSAVPTCSMWRETPRRATAAGGEPVRSGGSPRCRTWRSPDLGMWRPHWLLHMRLAFAQAACALRIPGRFYIAS
jgi:hypothetical protein